MPDFFDKDNFQKMTKDKIDDGLRRKIKSMKIPAWIDNVASCPGCERKLSRSDLHGISLAVRARHIGDMIVSFMCQSCSTSSEFHYRKACPTFESFLHLTRKGPGRSIPIELKKMPVSANNLTEEVFGRAGTKDKEAKL